MGYLRGHKLAKDEVLPSQTNTEPDSREEMLRIHNLNLLSNRKMAEPDSRECGECKIPTWRIGREGGGCIYSDDVVFPNDKACEHFSAEPDSGRDERVGKYHEIREAYEQSQDKALDEADAREFRLYCGILLARLTALERELQGYKNREAGMEVCECGRWDYPENMNHDYEDATLCKECMALDGTPTSEGTER